MFAVPFYLQTRDSEIGSLYASHVNISRLSTPSNTYVMFELQMLSSWYDEFLNEEDCSFLTYSVGGALSWG